MTTGVAGHIDSCHMNDNRRSEHQSSLSASAAQLHSTRQFTASASDTEMKLRSAVWGVTGDDERTPEGPAAAYSPELRADRREWSLYTNTHDDDWLCPFHRPENDQHMHTIQIKNQDMLFNGQINQNMILQLISMCLWYVLKISLNINKNLININK